MSRKPDFTKIDFNINRKNSKQTDEKKWCELLEKEAGKMLDEMMWQTNEQIAVKPLYHD